MIIKRPTAAPGEKSYFLWMLVRKRRNAKKRGVGRLEEPLVGDSPKHLSAASATAPQSRYNSGVRFRVRPFQKADFDTLWQIDQACFDPHLAYSRPELSFYMRRPGSFTLVANSMVEAAAPTNGKSPAPIPDFGILGFVVAEARRKVGHIITIDVIGEARRAGVGSALLHAAEEELLRAGAVAVALETPVNNADAIRFYKQKGYFVEKTVAGYYSIQMDALVMTKELELST
jgi:ribosomal protein S18 acetylase RimI-like enzyme